MIVGAGVLLLSGALLLLLAYDPRLIARRVLATAYTTTAPNFIVIGIDYAQSRMLVHQLERSSVPKMTRELGAQPGSGAPMNLWLIAGAGVSATFLPCADMCLRGKPERDWWGWR